MTIYIISSVRNASEELKKKVEDYTQKLEELGHTVYLPFRDTNQEDKTGLNICLSNTYAIFAADEIHVFYDPESLGSHFDLGVAFAAAKPIKYIEGPQPEEGVKSFPSMLKEYAKQWGELNQERGKNVYES